MIGKSTIRLTNQSLSLLRTSIFGGINSNQRFQNTKPIENDKYSYHSPIDGIVRTSQYDPVTIPDTTLDRHVLDNLHKYKNKVATVCVVTGRQYTYSQIRDHCAALAVRLQQVFKLQPRDVVALALPNLPEYPIALFGPIEAGLVVSTVNPIYKSDEIARQLEISNAKLVIGLASMYSTLKEACEIAKKNIPIVCIRTTNSESLPTNSIDFYELINSKNIDFNQLKEHDLKPEDLLFLPFSSGTTGLPKGVMLTHRNIISNCQMLESKSPFPEMVHEATDSFQESIPCFLPFFHIYGLTVTLASKLKLGCKLVTLPKFTPDDLIKSLEVHKGTILNVVPPILLFLSNNPKITAKTMDSCRMVMSGAAPIGALDVNKFIKKFPKTQFIQGFGLTETSPVVIFTPLGCTNYSSAGFLAANTEGRIIDINDKEHKGLGPNQTGEICVRGEQIMKGYINNEEATKDILIDNNWLRTGDIGYYDEEGYFYITDRIKELIKVKGFQVPPAELEELLRDHPKILDAGVIGLPHPELGEAPRAFVVLKPNTEATEDEIKKFISEKVVKYKQLENGVVFIDEIPKSAAGKILRRELKSKYCK